MRDYIWRWHKQLDAGCITSIAGNPSSHCWEGTTLASIIIYILYIYIYLWDQLASWIRHQAPVCECPTLLPEVNKQYSCLQIPRKDVEGLVNFGLWFLSRQGIKKLPRNQVPFSSCKKAFRGPVSPSIWKITLSRMLRIEAYSESKNITIYHHGPWHPATLTCSHTGEQRFPLTHLEPHQQKLRQKTCGRCEQRNDNTCGDSLSNGWLVVQCHLYFCPSIWPYSRRGPQHQVEEASIQNELGTCLPVDFLDQVS